MVKNRVVLGVDADGGDTVDLATPAQRVTHAARLLAQRGNQEQKLVICGHLEKIVKGLTQQSLPHIILKNSGSDFEHQLSTANVSVGILPATETHEKYNTGKIGRPKSVKGTSFQLLAQATKQKKVDGFFSIGNTVHVITEATHLRRIDYGEEGSRKRIKMPTFVGHFPSTTGYFVATDIGVSNLRGNGDFSFGTVVEGWSAAVYQQALMAATYAKMSLGVERPRLGILSNGTEDYKGSDLVQETVKLFYDSINNRGLDEFIDFKGQVEPDHCMQGEIDVIATDGFTGNISIKWMQATAKLIQYISTKEKDGFTSTDKLRLALGKGPLAEYSKRVKDRVSGRGYAGAVTLGFDGIVGKHHGVADALGIVDGIDRISHYIQNHVNDQIKDVLRKYS